MAKFRVNVEGTSYRVEAPDEATAWEWANQTHRDDQVKLEEAGKAKGGEHKIGVAGLPEAMKSVVGEKNAVRRAGANFALGLHTVGEALAPIGRGVANAAAAPVMFAAKAAGYEPPQAPDEGQQSEADALAASKLAKQGAAEAVPGGGAYQMAGELLPSLAVPGGGAASLARATGGKVLSRALQSNLLARAADMGVTGAAVNMATTPGDLEDRVIPGAMGLAGGALPILGAAGKGVYRAVRPSAAGRAAGREAGVAERMVRDIGDERAQEIVGKLDAPTDDFTRAGVQRPTAAQVTRDPTLQQTELGLRVQRPELFQPIDDAAAQGRWGKLGEIAQDQGALDVATGARSTATKPLREAALERAGQAFDTAPVSEAVDKIMTGESRTNPQALTLAKWVQGHLDEGMTPAQLYTMRKTLTSGIPHGTELGSAMTQARAERVGLVKAIDDALEKASGGQWSPYMEKFKEMSGPVTSMKTGQAIQKDFAKTPQRTMAGDPVLTPGRLRQSLAKHGEKQFGGKTFPRLAPEERETVEAIARSIEAEHAARTAQATIGSGTAGNLAASNRAGEQMMRGGLRNAVGGGVPGAAVDAVAGSVSKSVERARQDAFARLMADPAALREALAKAIKTTGRGDLATEAIGGRATRLEPLGENFLRD